MHPVPVFLGEAAQWLREVTLEDDGAGQGRVERFLPATHEGLDARGGRLLAIAAHDEGEVAARQQQVAHEVGAKEAGAAGDGQEARGVDGFVRCGGVHAARAGAFGGRLGKTTPGICPLQGSDRRGGEAPNLSGDGLVSTFARAIRRVSELASGLTRNQMPRKGLWVRIPCPPLW